MCVLSNQSSNMSIVNTLKSTGEKKKQVQFSNMTMNLYVAGLTSICNENVNMPISRC